MRLSIPFLVRFFTALIGNLLAAQAGVFIVDAASGPGTNFTSLQTALTTVGDGSTLVVRSGNYGAIDIVGLDVAVLGEPGATVLQLGVHNTGSHQRVLVTGLLVASFVAVGNALGPVVLDGGGQTLGAASWGLLVQDAANVHLRRWRSTQLSWLGNPCSLINSNAVVEGCTLTGVNFAGAGQSASSGIWAQASEVTLIDTQSYGGNGGTVYVPFALHSPGGAGIEVQSATVRIAGASVLQGGLNSTSVGGRAAAVRSSFSPTGTALIAPSVVTSTPLASGTTVLPLAAPLLRATSGNLGGTVTATRSGTPATVCALLGSGAVAPFTFPGIDGPIWIDPTLAVLVALGITAGNGELTASLSVPNVQALLGFTFVWQAADLDALGGLHLSNPSASYVF
jgi:hypothetical protein